ncbi:MAG: InlB B-repeat-containing protein, partial [Clostridiales bacterium]|nr:InlB B-repeat-containing protein [Clostridiales bacterium]
MNKNISTIRRKITLPIILLILAALCLFGCVACAHEFLTEEDVKKDFPIAVIFDYNGGNVEGEATTKIRVKENSYVPEPGNEQLSNLAAPTRAKYTLKGFFLAKTDEDGKPIRGEDGKPVLDREWDFKTDKPDADITLFADWWDNYEMILHYGDNLTKSIDIPRNPDGTPTAVTAADARVLNYTFI